MHDGKVELESKIVEAAQILIGSRLPAGMAAPAFARNQPNSGCDCPGSLCIGRDRNLQLRRKRQGADVGINQANLIGALVHKGFGNVEAQPCCLRRRFGGRESNMPDQTRVPAEEKALNQRMDLIVSDREFGEAFRLRFFDVRG